LRDNLMRKYSAESATGLQPATHVVFTSASKIYCVIVAGKRCEGEPETFCYTSEAP